MSGLIAWPVISVAAVAATVGTSGPSDLTYEFCKGRNFVHSTRDRSLALRAGCNRPFAALRAVRTYIVRLHADGIGGHVTVQADLKSIELRFWHGMADL